MMTTEVEDGTTELESMTEEDGMTELEGMTELDGIMELDGTTELDVKLNDCREELLGMLVAGAARVVFS